MTYEQEREKLEKRQADERARLEQEHEIRSLIPPDLAAELTHSYHAHKLYGHDGSLVFRFNRFASLVSGPMRDPDLRDVIRLAQAFPRHAEHVLYKSGGCTSVRERASLPDDADERGTVSLLAPYWITIDPAIADAMVIHWTAAIGSRYVRLEVHFRLTGREARSVGRLALTYKYYGGHHGEIASVDRNDFTVNPNIAVIGNSSARQVRCASGDRKTPGQHLIVWERGTIDDADTSAADLAALLIEESARRGGVA